MSRTSTTRGTRSNRLSRTPVTKVSIDSDDTMITSGLKDLMYDLKRHRFFSKTIQLYNRLRLKPALTEGPFNVTLVSLPSFEDLNGPLKDGTLPSVEREPMSITSLPGISDRAFEIKYCLVAAPCSGSMVYLLIYRILIQVKYGFRKINKFKFSLFEIGYQPGIPSHKVGISLVEKDVMKINYEIFK